ncbi:MAG: hypothetical protein A2Z02_02185 [Chloroflexi bacterium RBG_16_48_7]|nr:MAG: hypothetical protein A2Z02_02185 [Chloroflexi bacterium RBG_16_48_7]
MDTLSKKQQLTRERRKNLELGGGTNEVEKQHRQKKLTARERLAILFDEGTFQEIDLWIRPIQTGFDIDKKDLPGDAVITGFGKINGRIVYAYSHDFTVVGGTMSSGQDHKVTRLMEMAMQASAPYVGLIDSGGVRIHDLFGRSAFRPIQAGRISVGGTTGIFAAPSLASGMIPQISVMLGPCYAGSAYSPTLADFLIMRKNTSFMSVASPELLKTVTFEDVTREAIGGAELHATTTGTADYLAETDADAIQYCRKLLTYLPQNYKETTPLSECTDDSPASREELNRIAGDVSTGSYDMHNVIEQLADNRQFLEVQELFAPGLIIGFIRINGQSIGIVANNPAKNGGLLNINTCDKAARFIRFCDCFNLPIVFLVDTPGFDANSEEERSKDGLIRTAARPIFAVCEATVPMIVIYIGKCYGPARLVMGTPRMGIDMVYSWPTAQVARMDPTEVTNIIYKREIDSSEEPGKVRDEKLGELLQRYIVFPFHGAEQLMVNEIIEPSDTRPIIVNTLKAMINKAPLSSNWKKHSLIPK